MAGISAMELRTQDYFRFLDLPAELRLMVYEEIPSTTSQQSIKHGESRNTNATFTEQDLIGEGSANSATEDGENDSATTDSAASDSSTDGPKVNSLGSPITMMKKSFPLAILRVCRYVNSEAKPIIERRLRQLEQEPVRVVAELAAFVEGLTRPDLETEDLYWDLHPLVHFLQPSVSHVVQARPLPGNGRHVEVVLKTTGNELWGSDVCRALDLAWSAVRKLNLSWTIHCQGALPDVQLVALAPVPGLVFWAAYTAADVVNDPIDHGIVDLMMVKELGEKDWAQLLEEWEAW
jgi:hypothetical protein